MANGATDEAARAAFNQLTERSQLSRRKTGTIVAINGRNVSVLLDGEGTSVLTAYRGAFEPSLNAGVTVERVVGTNHWRVVGIRDSALGVLNENPYDLEVRGNVLYYPLALEAINDVAYNLGNDLEITLYNIQYLGTDGLWRYVASQVIDFADYVPSADSRWAVVYADALTGTVNLYGHTTTGSPDGAWPAAVNGLLTSMTAVIPLLAVRMDSGMTEWGNAWKVIVRGYLFTGKHIVRIPFSAGTGDSAGEDRYYRVHGDISANDSTLSLNIPEINIRVALTRTGSADPVLSLRTATGTETYDYRRWSIKGASTVSSSNAAGNSYSLTTTPHTVDSAISMNSDDNTTVWVRRAGTDDVWQVNTFISDGGERTTIWAAPVGVFGLNANGWSAVPPTNAELDTAFGSAASVGAGFTGMIDDTGGEANLTYFVVSDGTAWWYTPLRPAT